MDNRIPPTRPDVVSVISAPRPTPTPPRVPFANVLAAAGRSVVSGAEAAVGLLPGGPMMAMAIRNGAGMSTSVPMSFNGSGGTLGGSGAGMTMSAEGPRAGAAPGVGGVAGGVPGAAGAPGGGGIESSLQQAQEMNLYYLQIQQEVQQQNQTFSTLSNVMKAEHDTVKNAIGNLR